MVAGRADGREICRRYLYLENNSIRHGIDILTGIIGIKILRMLIYRPISINENGVARNQPIWHQRNV